MEIFENIARKTYRRIRRTVAYLWLNFVHKNTIQIAIAGSYGKTSVANAVFQIISRTKTAIMTDINLDTLINVPKTALKLYGQKYAVFELGIDQIGEMDTHLEIVKPRISLITGITPVHSDNKHLASLNNIISEKRKVIEVLTNVNFAVLNFNDQNVRNMAHYTNATVIFFGTDPVCDIYAHKIQSDINGIQFKVSGKHDNYNLTSQLLGKHNAINLTGAIAVAEILGLGKKEIEEAIFQIKPLKGRLNVENGPNGLVLINDSLRANPASTIAGLEFVGNLLASNRKKIAVLGEMGELGISSLPMHVEVGKVAYEMSLDFLICIGGMSRVIAKTAAISGMKDSKIHFVHTPQEAIQIIQSIANTGDILYLKASRLRHFERVKLLLAGEKVGCTVESCEFYHSCSECEFLITGLQNVL